MEKKSGDMARQGRGSGSRIIFVPFPAAGHMNPMLQLATLLYSKGFSITIFYAPFCLPDSPISHHFDLIPFPDSLPKPSITKEILKYVGSVNSICQETVLSYLPEMMKEDRLERIACIVSDPMMYFCQSFVDQFKVPQFILRTSNANTFLASSSLPHLRQNGLPLQGLPSSKV